ncbi:MAG TPA: GNAT family N-acetyltransferase [Candidatus Kapabacteria bacterium]|nr:GNAT family N-acetyltransferase [Candidatus Kapabacteria bacterium]HPO62899.1 GNAT family N-acetyltransferase [Candidatus Kapabacteria bacterium]
MNEELKLAEYLSLFEDNDFDCDSELALNILDAVKEEISTTKDTELLKTFLNASANHSFIASLQTEENRLNWVELVFKAIQLSGYNLLDMFENRVNLYPMKIYFQDFSNEPPLKWTYQQVFFHIREIAATFWKTNPDTEPRVAIFSENCFESACSDIACLCYDIPVTPINTQFNSDILKYIIENHKINVIVTDTELRLDKILKLKHKHNLPFKIFFIGNNANINEKYPVNYLGEYCKRLSGSDITAILKERKRRTIKQVATIMFTSGSTGMPKGVSFSMYNIITKRFARAAALPEVGENEVLLCYLPLFHTFGRYLEMLGMLFWSGTYTFCENPSADTVLKFFPIVNPTGFISIPLRWAQIYERIIEEEDKVKIAEHKETVYKQITGRNLRWGLSAAGYLSPDIFKFFQERGIELCSGFGMTEATGGITLTPIGKYVENSVGKPLPGINIFLDPNGELIISGHYVAHYDSEFNFDSEIKFPDEEEYMFKTGDVFKLLDDGHYEIIDRIKDIYKNNKGQTVSPRLVEQNFEGVAGVKRTFLVGDGKPYNVLFIVPDDEEPILKLYKNREEQRQYFRQIIDVCNSSLAQYDRIINFEILERDFSAQSEEITAKNTFNRKNIVKNFSNLIEDLYRNNTIELKIDDIKIKIPRWFFRDIGVLEDDIITDESGLLNRSNSVHLNIKKKDNLIQIGDLLYSLNSNVIELGAIVRQPSLWCGNNELLSFYPCKEGWDTPAYTISNDIHFCFENTKNDVQFVSHIKDASLAKIHKNFVVINSLEKEGTIEAVNELSTYLTDNPKKIQDLVRRRLFALCEHPEEAVRCLAYRILILDEPDESYNYLFAWFVSSGKSFLNSDTIEFLTFSHFEKRRLEALRKRLYYYRTNIRQGSNELTRQQIENIFELLVNFVSIHPEYYNSVRSELCSWVLLKEEKFYSDTASMFFDKLYLEYENNLLSRTPIFNEEDLNSKLVFDDNLDEDEIEQIRGLLLDRTFLKQSVMLAFDKTNFLIDNIQNYGIWINRVHSSSKMRNYRISINTISNEHFDLLLILFDETEYEDFHNAVFWMFAVASYPFSPRVLPRIGCCRPEKKAITVVYKCELNVWEQLRQLTIQKNIIDNNKTKKLCRRLFIEAFAAFFRAWRYSGYKIVPNSISPSNVIVSEQDFYEGAVLQNMSENKEYESALMFIKPMLLNFYMKTINHYPNTRKFLDITWIFDSIYEAIDVPIADLFLEKLLNILEVHDLLCPNETSVKAVLSKYIQNRKEKYYPPLCLTVAIDEYWEWKSQNQQATSIACEETITELIKLYRIFQQPEIARYYLYRFTYFHDADYLTKKAYDMLLHTLYINPNEPALNCIELSDLQNELKNDDDKLIFSRLVFPTQTTSKNIEVKKIGINDKERTAIISKINDKYNQQFIFRNPIKPVEVGNLYRLFYLENYPKIATENDRHFVLIDDSNKIVGGICYKIVEADIVLLDGIVVVDHLKLRGIGTALVKDFINRMRALNYKIIKTHFYTKKFFEKLGFQTHKSWGEFVLFLE